MKALVVYYSLTGRTRALAQALAHDLGADSEEIRCARYSPGFWVYVKGSYDSAAGRLPVIDIPERSPSNYDLVVLAGPIWASHAAPPVRAYLRGQAGRLSNVAFALTHRGSPPDKALRDADVGRRGADRHPCRARVGHQNGGTQAGCGSVRRRPSL